ncbi:cytochrome P450 [Crepidotus variabilis]|uniref:Cytochrome P450 n=1 Tax=Crepidotus variabilis TaxID=179855 RepID=A0A9P6EMM0_9AGAR|nr:cytochrome P450 [Crepidotus variabilis]
MHLINLLAILVPTCVLYRLKKRFTQLPLPPQPKGLPLVGHTFSTPSTNEWITFHEWSKELGTNILYLNVTGQSMIVLSSAKVAIDLLEKRSSIYSSRPYFPFHVDLMGAGFNTVLLNYGETWRRHRRLQHAFFGSSASSNYRTKIARTVHSLLGRLIEDSKDFKAQVQLFAGDTLISLCYGLDIATREGRRYHEVFLEGDKALLESAISGSFLVDFLPFLKYIPEWMPGAGFQTKARLWRGVIQEMIKLPFNATKENMETGNCPPCFVCTSLGSTGQKLQGPDLEDNVLSAAGSLFSAGVETTVSIICSCILGLLERPEVLQRAHEELDRVVQPGQLPDFNDQPSLPFVTAIAKESLRWRNVAPLGVAHYIEVEDEYEGYRIPKKSVVMVNQWALLHDEEIYPDPFAFKPERFMNGDVYNHETKDPEFACWGFGRRICPGRYLAFDAIWLTIASLIHAFNIEKEIDENGTPIEPNPSYETGAVYGPESFPCRIKSRSGDFAKLVQAAIVQHAENSD